LKTAPVHILFSCLLLAGIFQACKSSDQDSRSNRCGEINEDSLARLEGRVAVDSKGNVYMHTTDSTIFRRVLLIACDKGLHDYMVRGYDSYIQLSRMDEEFRVLVDGKWLVKTDTLDEPPTFLYNWIALLDKTEEANEKPDTSNVPGR
jgi:hypothetical protein